MFSRRNGGARSHPPRTISIWSVNLRLNDLGGSARADTDRLIADLGMVDSEDDILDTHSDPLPQPGLARNRINRAIPGVASKQGFRSLFARKRRCVPELWPVS